MTGLLKNNFIATALLGLSGSVLLLGLVMQITSGVDLEVDEDAASAMTGDDFSGAALNVPDELEAYAAIDERPLFNISRRPIAIDETAQPVDPAQGPEGPLNAALTGVMIVGDEMFVSMQDSETQQFVRARVGAGMDGAFADWQVTEIGPRSVTLTGLDGEELKLDMQVAQSTPDSPAGAEPAAGDGSAKPSSREQYQKALQDAGKADNNESRAEEIRRRIAERRAQLQAAADKKAAQQNGTEQ